MTFFYYKNSPSSPAAALDSSQIVIHAPQGDIKAVAVYSGPEQEKGLGDRDSLNDNEGMLFVFSELGSYGFWMKDMRFPLDMVWIDEDKTVVDITKDISPETFPNTFLPPKPVLYVLEINAGKAEKIGLKEGTQLSW